jgi:hypothetical protein
MLLDNLRAFRHFEKEDMLCWKCKLLELILSSRVLITHFCYTRRGHGYDKERTDRIMRADRTLLNTGGQGNIFLTFSLFHLLVIHIYCRLELGGSKNIFNLIFITILNWV